MKSDEIIQLLKEYKDNSKYKKNIKRMGIFGSMARNEFTDCSDIDVFVLLKSPKMFDLVGIKQDLEELTHLHVDIIMLRNRMNPFLRKRIEKEGVYV